MKSLSPLPSIDPCRNGGNCVDGVGSFSCDCSPGFEGVHCEIDVDECASHPCMNGASCTDYVNSFVCECQQGFDGLLCERNILQCTKRWATFSTIISLQAVIYALTWGWNNISCHYACLISTFFFYLPAPVWTMALALMAWEVSLAVAVPAFMENSVNTNIMSVTPSPVSTEGPALMGWAVTAAPAPWDTAETTAR